MKMFKRVLCFGLAMMLYVPMVNRGFAAEPVEGSALVQIETEPIEDKKAEESESVQVKVDFVEKKQSRVMKYAKIGAAVGAAFGGIYEGVSQYNYATSPKRQNFYKELESELSWGKWRYGMMEVKRIGKAYLDTRVSTPKLVINGLVNGTITGAMAGAGIGIFIGLLCDEKF